MRAIRFFENFIEVTDPRVGPPLRVGRRDATRSRQSVYGRPHGDQDRSAEAQAKFRAEQKGGRENVATDPNAQKHRDEQAALAEGK